MKKFFLYVFLTFASCTSWSYAHYDPLFSQYRRFSFDVQYSSFSDLLQNSNSSSLKLSPVINANLNFRMYRIFSLSLAYGKSSDKSWDYAGLGVRVDLPGVFLVNANPSEFVRRNKRRNLNTYFAAMKLITKRGGESQKFVSDKFGLGMDIFMAGSLYLNTELNLFSFEGNQFFSPSVGLGFEF